MKTHIRAKTHTHEKIQEKKMYLLQNSRNTSKITRKRVFGNLPVKFQQQKYVQMEH